jgi:hypothetical protein
MISSKRPHVERIPVTLTLLELELLVASCRQQKYHLTVRTAVTALFRYELYRERQAQDKPECVLRSNNLVDVTRFLGLDVSLTEPGFPSPTTRPTECLWGYAENDGSEVYVRGLVPLKQGVPTPLIKRQLPLLDSTSPGFRDRCRALGIKTDKPMQECKQALFEAKGDGERALDILALSN